MAASFGSGVAYSLVSGAPNPVQAAITTGAAFALFNGLFYQVGFLANHGGSCKALAAQHVKRAALHPCACRLGKPSSQSTQTLSTSGGSTC